MSEQKQKRGLRCHICTGCGLCPGVGGNGTNREKPHVLDEDALLGKREPLPERKDWQWQILEQRQLPCCFTGRTAVWKSGLPG